VLLLIRCASDASSPGRTPEAAEATPAQEPMRPARAIIELDPLVATTRLDMNSRANWLVHYGLLWGSDSRSNSLKPALSLSHTSDGPPPAVSFSLASPPPHQALTLTLSSSTLSVACPRCCLHNNIIVAYRLSLQLLLPIITVDSTTVTPRIALFDRCFEARRKELPSLPFIRNTTSDNPFNISPDHDTAAPYLLHGPLMKPRGAPLSEFKSAIHCPEDAMSL
jgi:hypothetical protein